MAGRHKWREENINDAVIRRVYRDYWVHADYKAAGAAQTPVLPEGRVLQFLALGVKRELFELPPSPEELKAPGSLRDLMLQADRLYRGLRSRKAVAAAFEPATTEEEIQDLLFRGEHLGLFSNPLFENAPDGVRACYEIDGSLENTAKRLDVTPEALYYNARAFFEQIRKFEREGRRKLVLAEYLSIAHGLGRLPAYEELRPELQAKIDVRWSSVASFLRDIENIPEHILRESTEKQLAPEQKWFDR
jgi:hypothetical protein